MRRRTQDCPPLIIQALMTEIRLPNQTICSGSIDAGQTSAAPKAIASQISESMKSGR
jgi:hypothetical protein